MKKIIIRVLRFLNNKPGFRSLFNKIYEMRNTSFMPDHFIATIIDDSFILGAYDIKSSPTWRRMANGSFEKSETFTIKELLPFFDVFIDIGGHIGYFTCMVGSHKPEMEILTFEPNPSNFRSLEKNIRMNKMTNVKSFNIGLAEKGGSLTLFGNDASSSLNTSSFTNEPREKVTVKIEKLDDYKNHIQRGKSSFIKIDVETSEYSVLKGGKNFIKINKPIGLLVEIVKYWSAKENPHFNDTFNLLFEAGYNAYLVEGDMPYKFIDDVNKQNGGNYLFLRRDFIPTLKTKIQIIQ